MSKFVFIADFFANEIPGGGELNNDEVCSILTSFGHEVQKVKCANITENILLQDANYIVANFVQLSEKNKQILQNKKKYIIYEHDHKYVKTRNPADYPGYLAPKSEIVNFDFYSNALAVLCQSKFHKNIVEQNLELNNIVSLGGNLWSQESLDLMRKISQKDKSNKCAIMASQNWHKNTADAIRYCQAKNIDFELILQCSYHDFLNKLGKHSKFIFLPKTPETLSRIVVEARMMGLTVIGNQNIGATKEDWFKYKGEQLIAIMENKRKTIPIGIRKMFLDPPDAVHVSFWSQDSDENDLIKTLQVFNRDKK